MNGSPVAKLPLKTSRLERILLTPAMAQELIERNIANRSVSDQHVARIARQITEGLWKFNGDTIKISDTGYILDGQHRLWAVIEANIPIETIVVYGIERDAFATIDTIRRARSGADTVALSGATHYRKMLSTALTWLLRWQSGNIENYRAPQNRIENSDIERAFSDHPGIFRAVERAIVLRTIANVSIMSFLYYVMASKNQELADRMIDTLQNPLGVAADDPFFRLRFYFLADHRKVKNPLVTIALCIKAANLAYAGRRVEILAWRSQGNAPESFPKISF